MKFYWSDLAYESLNEILDFLELKWTKTEKEIFFEDYKAFEQTIRDGIIVPPTYKKSKKKIQYMLLRNKQATVYFIKESENLVKIGLFWANKKAPRKLEKLLKSI